MGSREIEVALAEHACSQWGMFTAAQATRLGLSRKRLAWLTQARRVAHTTVRGVYRFAGAPVDPDREDLRAFWLSLAADRFAAERRNPATALADAAVVSHWSAASTVYRLGVTDTAPPVAHHFTVTTVRRTTSPRLVLHPGTVSRCRLVEGLPVTSLHQTVTDLITTDGLTPAVGAVVRDALLTVTTDTASLTAALDVVCAGRGRDTLTHLLQIGGASQELASANEQLSAARALTALGTG
ncbi:type IV toxin-antitoxin system AbiEi family antitoxin domain-containing protein [Mycolicibacterium sp. 3033]|nr:type IV toxin-antitoxin system AbiEi family antitoxin domain-containing protein [Mycolicibacterium aurantiacum]